MALADGDVRDANAAMQERRSIGPWARDARHDPDRNEIVVTLNDGTEFAFSPSRVDVLLEGRAADLGLIEISAAGLGLHWPRLDADLYLPALLEGIFNARQRRPGMGVGTGVSTMRFELHKDHAGEWRWRLRATNGNVLADSGEGYRRREDCERGIALVKSSAEAPVVDMSAKIAGGGAATGG